MILNPSGVRSEDFHLPQITLEAIYIQPLRGCAK